MTKKIFLLVFLAACVSRAATSDFGSWFKRNIADPTVNLFSVGYTLASNGVENVVETVSGATVFAYEKASNGSNYIMKYTSDNVRTAWTLTSEGLVYCGEEVKEGGIWVVKHLTLAGSLISFAKWYETQFKENTEGTADFVMDVGLDLDDGKFVATQIFELDQFIKSKNQFQSFNFRKAYATLNTDVIGGLLTWKVACYLPENCSEITIMSNMPISQGQKVESSDQAWKNAVLSLVNQGAKQAVLVFEISGATGSAENCHVTMGFSVGMKGANI